MMPHEAVVGSQPDRQPIDPRGGGCASSITRRQIRKASADESHSEGKQLAQGKRGCTGQGNTWYPGNGPATAPPRCPPSGDAHTCPPTDLRQSKVRMAACQYLPVHAAAERALHKAFTTAVARRALSRCRPDPGPSRGGHRSSKSRWVHVRYLRQPGAPEARRVRQRRG